LNKICRNIYLIQIVEEAQSNTGGYIERMFVLEKMEIFILKNWKNYVAYSIPLYTGSLPPNHPIHLMKTSPRSRRTKTPATMPIASMT